MMIKLSDQCYVAADQIQELKLNSHTNTITVRMKDGTGHCHTPAYKQSIYAALDQLATQINTVVGVAK